MVSFAGMAGL